MTGNLDAELFPVISETVPILGFFARNVPIRAGVIVPEFADVFVPTFIFAFSILPKLEFTIAPDTPLPPNVLTDGAANTVIGIKNKSTNKRFNIKTFNNQIRLSIICISNNNHRLIFLHNIFSVFLNYLHIGCKVLDFFLCIPIIVNDIIVLWII